MVVETHEHAAVARSLPNAPPVFVIDDQHSPAIAHLISIGSDMSDDSFKSRTAYVRADDVATIVYTSGTAGEPRGVALSHRAFVDHALGAAIHPDWGTLAYPDEYGNARILLFLRPAHVLDTFLNTVSQRAGGGLLGLKSKTADALVLNKAKAALGGRLRHVVCGGSRLSPDTARFFIGLGVLVMEGYGATERFWLRGQPVLRVLGQA